MGNHSPNSSSVYYGDIGHLNKVGKLYCVIHSVTSIQDIHSDPKSCHVESSVT